MATWYYSTRKDRLDDFASRLRYSGEQSPIPATMVPGALRIGEGSAVRQRVATSAAI